MARVMVGTLLALLASGSICSAEMAAYGNPSGCAALVDDWDHVSDLMVLVTPEKAVQWEQECPLTNPNYDGKEMRVMCSGEGEEWPLIITLYVNPDRPDVMIYSVTDPNDATQQQMVELSRCK